MPRWAPVLLPASGRSWTSFAGPSALVIASSFLPPLGLCYNPRDMKAHIRGRWRRFRPLIVAVALLGVCVCRGQADLETEIEQNVGRLLAQAFCEQSGVLRQPLLQEWVQEIGQRVVAESPRRYLEHHFTILDSPEPNAFALPGGYIFVTAGLLEDLSCDDELASIIAHEAGHVANRDFQRLLKRELTFLAIIAILKHNDRADLAHLTQGIQIVNTLRHSRLREAQADAFGVATATHAGYDARALTDFLTRGSAARWSYLETVFSTHPHPAKRIAWIQSRLEGIRADHPEQILAVAESLITRARYRAAGEVLAGLGEGGPLPARRATMLGEIALAQGHRSAAEQQFVCALELAPGDKRASAGLERARQMKPPPPVSWPGFSEEQAAELRRAETELHDAQQAGKEPSAAAWRHLNGLWRNHEVGRALMMAQAFDPELRDPAYLYLVAKSWDLLSQVIQGGNLVARTLNMRRGALTGLRSLSKQARTARPGTEQGTAALVALADRLRETGAATMRQASAAERELERLARGYKRSASSLAPILVELLLAGEGDPMGRLVFSRFAVLQAQVALNEGRLHRLHRDAWEAARAAWESDLELRCLRLNLLGAEATPAAKRVFIQLAARRLREDEEVVADSWENEGALGDGLLALAQARLGLDARDQATCEGFSPQLRVLRIVLRFCELEVATEQVGILYRRNYIPEDLAGDVREHSR